MPCLRAHRGECALYFHLCVDTGHGENTGEGLGAKGPPWNIEWRLRKAVSNKMLLERQNTVRIDGMDSGSDRASWTVVRDRSFLWSGHRLKTWGQWGWFTLIQLTRGRIVNLYFLIIHIRYYFLVVRIFVPPRQDTPLPLLRYLRRRKS